MSDLDPILSAWSASEPSNDFAAKVNAKLDAANAQPPRRRVGRRGRIGVTLGVAAAAAMLALAFVSLPRSGDHRVASRDSVAIGHRAVAVMEPGAALTYRVGWSGDAEIEQTAGNVFYRVERGGAFRVHTPGGDVVVHGTCFRVEVNAMKSIRSGALGATLGAAITATVLVTVYEGKVSLANPQGKVSLSAGSRAEASAQNAPRAVDDTTASTATNAAPSAPPGGFGTLSRDELVTQAEAQRNEIVGLHRQMTKLRSELDSANASLEGQAKENRRGFSLEPTPQELAEMAKTCTLKWDAPPLGSEPFNLGPKRGDLSQEERNAVNKAMAEQHDEVTRELRALYVEVTGDRAHADAAAADALTMELQEKSTRVDVQLAYQKLALERAGQLAPPANNVGQSAIERALRIVTGLGDRTERTIAQVIGADRARNLRKRNNGWDSRSVSSNGCPGGGDKE